MACLKANKYGWTRFCKSLVFVFVSVATVGGGGGYLLGVSTVTLQIHNEIIEKAITISAHLVIHLIE